MSIAVGVADPSAGGHCHLPSGRRVHCPLAVVKTTEAQRTRRIFASDLLNIDIET